MRATFGGCIVIESGAQFYNPLTGQETSIFVYAGTAFVLRERVPHAVYRGHNAKNEKLIADNTRLAAEARDVLAENARLRRKLEDLERKKR